MAGYFNKVPSKGGYDKQRAAAYAAYMMAGSYFKNDGNRQFPNLLLHYAEMPREKQYKCEEAIEKKMEALGEDFLGKLSELRSEARMSYDGGNIVIRFYTRFEGIRCTIDPKGFVEVAAV